MGGILGGILEEPGGIWRHSKGLRRNLGEKSKGS